MKQPRIDIIRMSHYGRMEVISFPKGPVFLRTTVYEPCVEGETTARVIEQVVLDEELAELGSLLLALHEEHKEPNT